MPRITLKVEYTDNKGNPLLYLYKNKFYLDRTQLENDLIQIMDKYNKDSSHKNKITSYINNIISGDFSKGCLSNERPRKTKRYRRVKR